MTMCTAIFRASRHLAQVERGTKLWEYYFLPRKKDKDKKQKLKRFGTYLYGGRYRADGVCPERLQVYDVRQDHPRLRLPHFADLRSYK